MKTKCSAFSRRLRAGVALRALTAGSASVGDLRSNKPGALIGTRMACRCFTAAFAALGLTALTSPSHAQSAPPLGTTTNFAVLAGSTITNTGPTVISGTAANPGNLGVSPGSAITGFPPGILTGPGATTNANDAVAIQAQVDLITAYNNLAGRPTTVDLTGQNLGGKTLVPGVYNFSSSAQLTGALTLNGLGNPNSVFIFNIGSTLTTASASTISLINGAQGGNVFWRVGSSATLGTTTSFIGDILALTSITLNTGATITCGAAWAQTGAVTLDTNTIHFAISRGARSINCGPGRRLRLGPTGFPLFASLLPSSASGNQCAVANAIDAFGSNGGTLPLAFLNLFILSPSQLANAFTQLSGEAGTGAAQAGTQAMNSFLSLVTNPFATTAASRRRAAPPPGLFTRTRFQAPSPCPIHAAGASGPRAMAAKTTPPVTRCWSEATIGRRRTYGYATGLDYRVTPYTVVGVALGGGGTNFGLSDGLGGGRSEMFQSAVYSMTRFNAAYISTAVAYAWHHVSTSRVCDRGGHRYPHRRFLRQQRRRPDRGRLSVRHSGRLWLAGVRVHPLRRIADAGLPHAVLQRDRRRRLTDFRACLQRAHDNHEPHRARRLVRPRPSRSTTARSWRCAPAPPGRTTIGPTRASPPGSSRCPDRASP